MRTRNGQLFYTLVSILVIIPLFRPRMLELYDGLNTLFFGVQCLLVMAMAFLFTVRLLKKGFKDAFLPVSYLVILFKLYELAAAYKNGIFDIATIINSGIIIAATVFADYLLGRVPKTFLSVLSLYTGLLVFINNISFFTTGSRTFTDATGNFIYFWSTKNHLSSLFFISFISAILFYGTKRTRFAHVWCFFSIINVIWGTIMFNSSTTVVGVAVLLVLYVLFKRKNILYKPVLWFWGGIALNIAIVIFRIQEAFVWLIEDVLNKNINLSGRTVIWDAALLYIIRNPIWGYGQSSVFSFAFASSEIPAHNQFLDIAIVCGIPGMILFGIVLFAVFRKLGKYRESFVSRLVACTLLGYIVMSIAESPNPYQPWFILFAIAYRVPEIDRVYKNVTYRLTKDLKVKRRVSTGSLQLGNRFRSDD